MKNTEIKWDRNFAYAIGLFTADGSMSSDARHFDFTSKDKEQVETFKKCLKLNNKIAGKSRGYSKSKDYFHVQFGDVKLYKYFQSIGLSARKSLTIKEVKVPDEFFPDFVRGYLDGDGSVLVYKHPESKHLQLKIRFYSGSQEFIFWLHSRLKKLAKIDAGTIQERIRAWWLIYSKRDSLKLINYIYYCDNLPQLFRKSNIALQLLSVNNDFNPKRWQNRFT